MSKLLIKTLKYLDIFIYLHKILKTKELGLYVEKH